MCKSRLDIVLLIICLTCCATSAVLASDETTATGIIQTTDGQGVAGVSIMVGGRDGYIHVTMTAAVVDGVDPYLQVFDGNASTFEDLQDLFDAGYLIDSDDDSGVGNAAQLTFASEIDQVYTIVLTTSYSEDYGNYRYTIYETEDPDVWPTSTDGAR